MFTQENTEGYTDEQLAEINARLEEILERTEDHGERNEIYATWKAKIDDHQIDQLMK